MITLSTGRTAWLFYLLASLVWAFALGLLMHGNLVFALPLFACVYILKLIGDIFKKRWAPIAEIKRTAAATQAFTAVLKSSVAEKHRLFALYL